MKILKLRFKNLNSLYGEWFMDFTDPEYVSNGIFALTGPTGAGKSTILDAICLALYGATPRLGKITKSGNEIMSRQTGECYAEVLFESQAGRFLCHWEQRRARKKADGNLQDQEHQIADADTGKLIETKKSLVGGVIEEKTGMDFDRFTRSILLAQGGFDTFLKADAEQKSRILEQITGTEIYSQISRRVHEKQKAERDRLNILNAETSGIRILDPEREKEIREELEEKQKQETELAVKFSETGKAIAWLTGIENLKTEILGLADEGEKLQRDAEAFKPERARLDQAVKAASLDGTYATLTALRKLQADDQTAFKTEEAALSVMEALASSQGEACKDAEQRILKAKEELKAASPVIQKIRSLDQRISDQARTIAERVESCAKEAAKIDTDKKAREKEKTKRDEAEKKLLAAEQYLKDHAQDEWLLSGLAGIEEQLANLLSKKQEIDLKKDELKTADLAAAKALEELAAAAKKCSLHKQELADATQRVQEGKDALGELLKGKLLREYRTEKETLLRERAFINKIVELEEHRTRLEDGKPCPLCGSTEHPYAKGNIPVPDEIDQRIELLTRLITRAEEQEGAIKKLEEAQIDARDILNASEKVEANGANDKRATEKTLGELKEASGKLQAGFEELKEAASGKLLPLGIREIPETEISSLIESLRSRMKRWQEQVRQKSDIEKMIAAIDIEVKGLDGVIDTQVKTLAEKQGNLERLKKEQAEATDTRKQLYGEKKPDEEEGRLNKAIEDAEEGEKKARSQNIEVQKKLTAAKTHFELLKNRIEQRAPELEKSERDFLAALNLIGFADEKLFFEARLTLDERESLSSRAKKLDDTKIDLEARQQDRQKCLDAEIDKKLTDKGLEELKPQFEDDEKLLKELRDNLSGLKHKLSENTAAKEQIKEKQSAIEAQKKECHRWEQLHGLIGSADGKKYRNFAQGLTFELMVSHANRQLEKMTDRYLLIRDGQHPLELNVVDNYQAGEIRSTKNLSGGESFIVSLTLALGLSKMASRKVRVDSLFLDEGFGSLDEEALETALETLSGLWQDGKLIGIISHVSAMKERISTQINVKPVSGGRSLLSGPGCEAILNK